MRVLLLLRGSPGCGKSTWIAENKLEKYTLCADDIRMMCSGPYLMPDGTVSINQSNDTVVWTMLFRLLETRMQNGEFTVIDATNSKTSEMNRYKELCSQYKYRMFCVDFTGIPIETVKEWNSKRPELKRVPDTAIDKMYARFATQKIPSGITVIKPNELDRVWMGKFDLSEYRRIHCIGDVHGCWTALREYLDSVGGIHDDEFYIFLGDYIDRGIENAEVVQFLLDVYTRRNVLLLEGNHERWLWVWANGGICQSKEFELVTKTQLENAGIIQKEVRQLYRRLGQCAYFNYFGNTYLVTHGGISTLPDNLTLVSTAQMMKGVGNYNDVELVDDAFMNNTPDYCFQIHGHRNTKGVEPQTNERCFNLEGHVEFGGDLRVVQLWPEGSQRVVTVRNTVFKKHEELAKPQAVVDGKNHIGNVILALRQNKFIQEKRFGNISSFNFTKQAFYDKVWDEQTTKARGLYINIPKQKIVARAYDKFFNVNERPETKLDMLQHKLAFPVTMYVKENGFLGIVSYNEEDDSLFVASKSCIDGDFAMWLRANLETLLGFETLERMKQYAKEHNVSFVFECVDMVHDPHIIEYPENRLYLLDIIYNEMPCRKYDFASMCTVAGEFGIRHKEKALTIGTWQEFFDWYYTVTSDDYLYNGRHIEGFVIEDANGYMVKLKLSYYNLWKFLRGVAHETIRKGYIDPKRTAALASALTNQFYGWIKQLRSVTAEPETIPTDICTLRRMFFESEAGSQFVLE